MFLDDLLEGVSLFNLWIDLFLLELLQAVLDVFDCAFGLFEELASALTINIETENFWLIQEDLRGQNDGIGVVLKENLRERTSEVSTIYVDLSELRQVDFFTAWAEDLETGCFQRVWETNRQNLLLITECARACTVGTSKILLVNFGETSGWVNISLVNEPIKVRCFLIQF